MPKKTKMYLLEVADSQEVASVEEQLERMEAMKTQGRKGCKAKRINMAFSPKNHNYINVMSRISGMTLTEYVNHILDECRTKNEDKYKKAKELIIG